jgi:hypothetical protein
MIFSSYSFGLSPRICFMRLPFQNCAQNVLGFSAICLKPQNQKGSFSHMRLKKIHRNGLTVVQVRRVKDCLFLDFMRTEAYDSDFFDIEQINNLRRCRTDGLNHSQPIKMKKSTIRLLRRKSYNTSHSTTYTYNTIYNLINH